MITGIDVKIPSNFELILNKRASKILLLGDSKLLKFVSNKVKESITQQLSMTLFKPYFLEFMDVKVGKGQPF